MPLTTGEVNQLNIDLADLQKKVNNCVDKQRVQTLFAFHIYDAPSERVQQESLETYWELEQELQDSLRKIRKIKEKLR